MLSASDYVIRGPKIEDKFVNKCLGEVFFEVLKTGNPDDVLLVDASYGLDKSRAELLSATIKLAHYLKEKCVKTDDVVGIISTNSWKFLASVISVAYLGCTVTVSNPNYLHDDLNHFLRTTDPKVLFVTSQVYKIVEELLHNHRTVELIIIYDSDTGSDTIWFEDILRQHVEISTFMPTRVDPETTLSHILFSSGTTGLPKGVMHTQNGFKHCLNVLSHPQNGALNTNHRVLIVLPLFHIFGLITAIGGIVNNAKVLLLEKFKPDTFLKVIQEYKATYLPVVPTLLQFLSKHKIVDEYDLSSLRDIFCGGAPVGEGSEKLIAKRFNNLMPRQIFGTTEAGGGVIIMPPGHRKSGSVGKVVIGCEAKILDPESQMVLGPNKIGEICIRGPNVMKGYLKNEEATKRDLDQDGFLHTGDLGYYDKEMYFYVVDRIKEVMKYKGFQVAPAQLENILFQHPGVKEVSVVGKPDDRVGELPTAFVVKQEGVSVTENELVQLVAQHLHADKQLHGGVIFVEEIPKTQSGKVARAELRKRFQSS